MKNLIQKALNDAFNVLSARVPQTKKEIKSLSILDVNPSDILVFMAENNIPNTAYFNGADNGYDGWNDILICWVVDVPTTEKDKLNFSRQSFTHIAWKKVYETLTPNGYKGVFYNTGLLKDFDDTTVYDMYVSQDWDRLVKYYSLPFVKSN